MKDVIDINNKLKGPQRPVHLRVNLQNCPDLKCEACGQIYFTGEWRYKVISALISPSKKEEVVPIQVMRCSDCGTRKFNEQVDTSKDEKNTDKKG